MKNKDFEEEPLDEISKALGASRQIRLGKYDDGPSGWLHMAHDVSRLQAYERQKELQDAVLWQSNTEGVQPKLFNITSPISVYYEEIV